MISQGDKTIDVVINYPTIRDKKLEEINPTGPAIIGVRMDKDKVLHKVTFTVNRFKTKHDKFASISGGSGWAQQWPPQGGQGANGNQYGGTWW